jgi:hypothetical protein
MPRIGSSRLDPVRSSEEDRVVPISQDECPYEDLRRSLPSSTKKPLKCSRLAVDIGSMNADSANLSDGCAEILVELQPPVRTSTSIGSTL